jgi:hypothetical protein
METILPKIYFKHKLNFITFPIKNFKTKYNLHKINFNVNDLLTLKEKNILTIHYDDPLHSQR